MDRMPNALPKVEPTAREITFWTVEGIDKVETESDSDEEPDASKSQEQKPEAGLVTFRTRAEQIGRHLVEGMQMISVLRTDIDMLEKAMFTQMSEEKRIAASFGRWDADALRTFIYCPVSVMQMECTDKIMQQYTRLIFSPAFYRPMFGFLLSDSGIGGMCVELMNSYSRINFPITDILADELGVPKNLDLIVTGTKIHGSSLPYCYRDIPGTIEDGDHTLEHPSISVHPSPEYGCLARQWLAQHAVAPFGKRSIPGDHIRFNEPLTEVMQDEAAKAIWIRFRESGRITVFTSDVVDGRRMIAKIIGAIKGMKVIIFGANHDRAMWTTFYPANTNRDIAYLGPDDYWTSLTIRDVLTVVVDNVHHIEVEKLMLLYGYTGNLIVLANDPILDFAGDNDSAAIVHGLTNCACFDLVKKSISSWGSAVGVALRKLQGLKPIRYKKKAEKFVGMEPEYYI